MYQGKEEHMFNEENIDFAKLMLARVFADSTSRAIGVKNLFRWLKGCGATRADLKEARKRLGIESKASEEGQVWEWPKNSKPKTVWERINRDLAKEGRHEGKRD